MGVPGFFSILYRYYRYTLVEIKDTISERIDNHGIDLNAVVHPKAQGLFKKDTNSSFNNTSYISGPTRPRFLGKKITESKEKKEIVITNEMIYELVCKEIEKQVQVVKPQKRLYLGVDGVAGISKQNQQKLRRFRGLKEKLSLPNGREDLEKFDSNCISCGTEFMKGLCEFIKEFISKKKSEEDKAPLWKDLEIIFSSDLIPGEGEHKIIRYFMLLPKEESFMIFSPDADLIMLALGTHLEKFFILRSNDNAYIPDCNFIMIKIKE